MNLPRYFFELVAAFGLYVGLLLAAKSADRHWHLEGWTRTVWALLPMLGCLAMLWVVMRAIRRMDELQRRIQFEALAFAFAATALGSLSYGFLEGAGFPRAPIFAVWPGMAVLWIVGLAIAGRRYR